MAYKVTFVPAAARQLKKLARNSQLRLIRAIEQLGDNPRPVGCETMTGPERFLRIRVGDYRIVYQVNDDQRVLEVLIVRVGHRREVYRFLRE